MKYDSQISGPQLAFTCSKSTGTILLILSRIDPFGVSIVDFEQVNAM